MAKVRDIYEAMSSFSGVPRETLEARHNQRSTWHERFMAWHLMRRHHDRLTRDQIDRIVTGASDDNQIDALLILANGEPMLSPEEAAALVENEAVESLVFVFMQATTSESFKLQKMQATIMGICNFFLEPPSLDENAQLQTKREVARRLTSTKTDGPARVQVFVYYAALGSGMDDGQSEQRKRALQFRASAETMIRDRLDAWVREHAGFAAERPTVERPHVELINLQKLRAILRDDGRTQIVDDRAEPAEPRLEREIDAPHLIAMPATDKLKAGYVGFVAGAEYLRLLQSADGMGLLEELSSRNVRRFLGHDNPVNREIAGTLQSRERSQFLVRNNGVTVVARDATLVAGRLRLVDYQIVNGLQTSHILYQHRDRVEGADDVFVGLKVIVTEDEGLTGTVSRATNRQTDITDLQAESASPVVVRIAAAFDETRTSGGGQGLWLERHAGEHDDSIAEGDSPRVIELDELVRGVGATVLGKPHVASGHPAQLRARIPSTILNEGDHVPVYVAVGQILFHVRRFMAGTGSDIERRFRFHLASGLYEFVRPEAAPGNLTAPQWARGATVMLERLAKVAQVDDALAQVGKSLRDQTRKHDLSSVRGRRIHEEAAALVYPLRQSVRAKVARFEW